jgi:hypothetical protein
MSSVEEPLGQSKIKSEDLKPNDPKPILRQIRNLLVELFVTIARILFFWLPGGDVGKGKALMAFHPILIASITFLFFLLPPRSLGRLLILVAGIITVSSQWLLGGCVITRAEQVLTGDKETIVDPFLQLARVAVNRDTRVAATLGVGTAITVLLGWSFLCDCFQPYIQERSLNPM